MAVRSF